MLNAIASVFEGSLLLTTDNYQTTDSTCSLTLSSTVNRQKQSGSIFVLITENLIVTRLQQFGMTKKFQSSKQMSLVEVFSSETVELSSCCSMKRKNLPKLLILAISDQVRQLVLLQQKEILTCGQVATGEEQSNPLATRLLLEGVLRIQQNSLLKSSIQGSLSKLEGVPLRYVTIQLSISQFISQPGDLVVCNHSQVKRSSYSSVQLLISWLWLVVIKAIAKSGSTQLLSSRGERQLSVMGLFHTKNCTKSLTTQVRKITRNTRLAMPELLVETGSSLGKGIKLKTSTLLRRRRQGLDLSPVMSESSVGDGSDIMPQLSTKIKSKIKLIIINERTK